MCIYVYVRVRCEGARLQRRRRRLRGGGALRAQEGRKEPWTSDPWRGACALDTAGPMLAKTCNFAPFLKFTPTLV